MKALTVSAAYRTFLAAVNDTSREYLVIGDMAVYHFGVSRLIRKLEIWLPPLPSVDSPDTIKQVWEDLSKRQNPPPQNMEAALSDYNELRMRAQEAIGWTKTHNQMTIWAAFYERFGKHSDLADKFAEKIKIYESDNLYGVKFNTAYATSVDSRFRDQDIKLISAPLLIAQQLGAATSEEQVEAARLLWHELQLAQVNQDRCQQQIHDPPEDRSPKLRIIKTKL